MLSSKVLATFVVTALAISSAASAQGNRQQKRSLRAKVGDVRNTHPDPTLDVHTDIAVAIGSSSSFLTTKFDSLDTRAEPKTTTNYSRHNNNFVPDSDADPRALRAKILYDGDADSDPTLGFGSAFGVGVGVVSGSSRVGGVGGDGVGGISHRVGGGVSSGVGGVGFGFATLDNSKTIPVVTTVVPGATVADVTAAAGEHGGAGTVKVDNNADSRTFSATAGRNNLRVAPGKSP